MLGSMIAKIRKEQHMTKVELAKRTGINIGHITHIEKGERHPSHKALMSIAKALDVPYQTLTHLYDERITEDTIRCNMIHHLSSHKVLAIDSYSQFMDCPSSCSNASVALKIQDDVMEPYLTKNSYAFLELNVPLKHKDIGLFQYHGEFYVRRFIIRKDKLVLRADNKAYSDINLSEDDDFIMIGRIQKGETSR